MADQGDLKELLRMLTARKVTMLVAMKHIKSLQAENLKRISDIAEAPLSKVEQALGDQKLAKSFHTACKTHGKKRPADEDSMSPSANKKQRMEPHKHDLDYASMSSDDLEAALALPLVEDEAVIRATKLVTNRAPLVLAFAVELLRVTMPEQPPSSRLSLAQAVVSANSRTKAVSIGIEKPPPGDQLIPDGQPTVRVLGREVPVLKRGGYTWKGSSSQSQTQSQASTATVGSSSTPKKTWSASRRLTSRDSTFIAHAAHITSPSARAGLIKALMAEKPELEGASHNAWAVRTSFGNSPLKQEASYDDGESGCGSLMLQVMRESDTTNTVVVLTRWFGGTMLGPDRWRLMREAVNDALSSQRRSTPTLAGEALWALDPQDKTPTTSTIGMAIHRPEGARNYLLRSFVSKTDEGDTQASPKKTTATALNEEKQENLGRLLGALRLLFASWAEVLDPKELDRRAWGWYVSVRPDIESGAAGWGAKGTLNLGKILDLRR